MLRTALILMSLLFVAACGREPAHVRYVPAAPAGWTSFGGAPGGGHYSRADQITPQNVHALTRAWEWRSGHARQPGPGKLGGYDVPLLPGSTWQMTPLVVDGALYGCTAFGDVFSLDASTGKQRWRVASGVDPGSEVIINCRGVSYWAGEGEGSCAHRILAGTPDARLLALDADTGAACTDFGTAGAVDLKQGMGEVVEHEYSLASPPAILGNLAIIGSWVLDRAHVGVPSGVVRAYDVRTGALAWYWDAVPPGQPEGTDAAGKPRFRPGTTNVWSIISVDPERNLVFLPTGNTDTDFYGVDRHGSDYWSASVVALDGSTGAVKWRFQTVHHDLWDFDTPAQPTLFDMQRDGKTIPALAQPTKMGHLFILDRETGEPLFPVEERPVPQRGAVPGEVLSPTQPFPLKPEPLVKARLRPEDAWGFTFWDRAACRREIESLLSDGIFTPPSIQGSVMYPGDMGGNNWGTPAIDPVRGLIVLNSLNMAQKVRLIPREQCELGKDPRTSAMAGTPYCVQVHPLLSPLGAPCVAPPWSTLVAIDMHTGDRRWEVPLGNLEGLAPWPVSGIQGAPSVGGPSVSAGGLTFIASTTDAYIRAFDTATGEELWKAPLPTGGHAVPASYTAPQDGRQYVVITAGGHWGVPERPAGDHLIAFALPSGR